MTQMPVIVYFLCECRDCAKKYAVATDPVTRVQYWYDYRWPMGVPVRVAGEGYACPWCFKALAGDPAVLAESGAWVRIGQAAVTAPIN